MSLRRRRTTTLLAIVAFSGAGALAFACGYDGIAGKEGPTPGVDSGDDSMVVLPPMGDSMVPDAPADVTVDAAEAGCPVGHGDMVEVRDAGGLTFCIDSTEVTNAAYATFVTATDGGNPDSGVFDAAAPDGCAFNSSYQIVVEGMATFPAVNVNWCDAYAYCAWAGKRLCGKTSDADAATGEWYAACSNGGTRLYPYGSSYVANACNDTSGSTLAVGSRPQCEGGVPGIYDMVGNVAELVDSCSAAGCAQVGGPSSGSGTCLTSSPVAKTTSADFLGFRCCGDLR